MKFTKRWMLSVVAVGMAALTVGSAFAQTSPTGPRVVPIQLNDYVIDIGIPIEPPSPVVNTCCPDFDKKAFSKFFTISQHTMGNPYQIKFTPGGAAWASWINQTKAYANLLQVKYGISPCRLNIDLVEGGTGANPVGGIVLSNIDVDVTATTVNITPPNGFTYSAQINHWYGMKFSWTCGSPECKIKDDIFWFREQMIGARLVRQTSHQNSVRDQAVTN